MQQYRCGAAVVRACCNLTRARHCRMASDAADAVTAAARAHGVQWLEATPDKADPAIRERVLAWLSGTSTWLFDCDGVLWRGNDAVPGASATVEALRRAGKRVFFVTNNSTKSRATYVRRLESVCGLHVREDEIVTSAHTAAEYLRRVGVTKSVYTIGGDGLVAELEGVGLRVLGREDALKPFSFGTLHPDDLDPSVQAVVVGFDGQLSYSKLAMACSYLRYGGPSVRFIATNRDLTFPDTHMLVPGGGVAVAAVEAGTGRAPEMVAGKPSLHMLEHMHAVHGLDAASSVMVGDRLDTDILFGNQGGVGATVLVLTGVSSAAEVAALPARDGRAPTHMAASVADLAAWLAALPTV